jgi:hypothetical protein
MPNYKKAIVEDPAALAHIVTGLGGTVLATPNFTFDLPMAKVNEAVPQLNQLGISVQKVGEYTTEHPTKLFNDQTVVRLKLCRQEEQKSENSLREGALRYLFDR